MSAHPLRRALSFALRLLLAGLVAFGLWLFVRGIDLRAVLRALRSASPGLLALAALVNLVHLGLRMLRLRELVRPAREVGKVRLYRYFLALSAGNTLLPARAGEAVRIWLLHVREGVAPSTAISASVVEKISDVAALLVVVAPLPWLLPDLPLWLAKTLSFSGLAAAVLIALLAALLHAHRHHPVHTLRGRLALGGRALHDARGIVAVSLLSFAVWFSDAATLLLVMRAAHTQTSLAGALFVLLTLNVAIAAPSTPAQVGAFELGAVAALRVLHLSEESALAVALLYHLIQAIPVTVLGLPDLLLITRARAAARAGSSPAAPSAPPADT